MKYHLKINFVKDQGYYNEYTSLLERIEIEQGETLVYWKTFSYDPVNWRVSSISTPEGTINYEYNNYGGLSRITTSSGQDVSYLYDEMGRLLNVISRDFSSSGDEVKKFSYEYSSLGRLEKKTYPNGTEVVYTFNDRGNIATITHKKEADQLLRLEYTRDKRGIITQLIEKRKNKSDVTWNYTYDYQKRLTNATRAVSGGSTTTYSYSYDDASNRTQKVVDGDTTTTTTYTYNSLDQLIQENSTDTSEVKTYVYDELGNLKYEKTDGAAKREYFWDSKNCLTKGIITDTVTQTVYFGYDENGSRISKKVDSDPETKYLTDYKNPTGYSQVLSEYNASDPEDFTKYYYGDQLLAQNDSTNGLSYFHTDHLYSNRLLTDSSGSAISNSDFNYSPYGIPINGDSSLTNYRFTGQFLDSSLGYQYHRARWLSTSRSSWISFDPVFDFPGNFGNGYGYCGNNPLSFIDIFGTFTLRQLFWGLVIFAILLSIGSQICPAPFLGLIAYITGGLSKYARRSKTLGLLTEKERSERKKIINVYQEACKDAKYNKKYLHGTRGNVKVSVSSIIAKVYNNDSMKAQGSCRDWKNITLDYLNSRFNEHNKIYTWEWAWIRVYKGCFEHNAVCVYPKPLNNSKSELKSCIAQGYVLDGWLEGPDEESCEFNYYTYPEWLVDYGTSTITLIIKRFNK